jgi:Domain of unknown function (DUF4352)
MRSRAVAGEHPRFRTRFPNLGNRRRTALAAVLLIASGVGVGYLAGHGADKTSTVTVTVGEPLQAGRPPYERCDKLGINSVEGRQGTCIRVGVIYTVVNRHTTLLLDQLEARITDVTVADSVNDVRAKAGSTYVVVTLRVRNRLKTAAQFDDAEQVLLADAKSEYAEDRRTGRLASDSFVKRAKAIPPGGSATGKVIFATSEQFGRSVAKPGTNLIISNFNDAGRLERARRLGAVRMWK